MAVTRKRIGLRGSTVMHAEFMPTFVVSARTDFRQRDTQRRFGNSLESAVQFSVPEEASRWVRQGRGRKAFDFLTPLHYDVRLGSFSMRSLPAIDVLVERRPDGLAACAANRTDATHFSLGSVVNDARVERIRMAFSNRDLDGLNRAWRKNRASRGHLEPVYAFARAFLLQAFRRKVYRAPRKAGALR